MRLLFIFLICCVSAVISGTEINKNEIDEKKVLKSNQAFTSSFSTKEDDFIWSPNRNELPSKGPQEPAASTVPHVVWFSHPGIYTSVNKNNKTSRVAENGSQDYPPLSSAPNYPLINFPNINNDTNTHRNERVPLENTSSVYPNYDYDTIGEHQSDDLGNNSTHLKPIVHIYSRELGGKTDTQTHIPFLNELRPRNIVFDSVPAGEPYRSDTSFSSAFIGLGSAFVSLIQPRTVEMNRVLICEYLYFPTVFKLD